MDRIQLLGHSVSAEMLRVLWIGLFVFVWVGVCAVVAACERLAQKDSVLGQSGNRPFVRSSGGA